MRYRFGNLRPALVDFRQLEGLVRGLQRDQRREFAARVMRRFLAPEPGRDLLAELGCEDDDFEWVRSLHEGIEALRGRGRTITLLACEYEPGPGGFLAVAGTDLALGRSIRLGDEVCAGFAALRDTNGELEVWPRIYRLVCTNGELMFSRSGRGVLHEAGSPRRAVERCLDPALLAGAAEACRRAAREPIEDPLLFLAGIRDAELREEILENFERARDRTRWGVANAITAAARRAPDFRRRLEIEKIGAAAIPIQPARRSSRAVGSALASPRGVSQGQGSSGM